MVSFKKFRCFKLNKQAKKIKTYVVTIFVICFYNIKKYSI